MICFPNAKINIGLHILNKREDRYHDIETVFCPISFSDMLEFIIDDSVLPGNCKLICTGIPLTGIKDGNLVAKAYKRLAENYALPGISLYLHKIIPPGSGLGGGSSDAAFLLDSMNNYFNLNIGQHQLEDMATSLGSDCPFFIRNEPVFAYERGNLFRELNITLTGYSVLIVYPGFHVNTAEAYRECIPEFHEESLMDSVHQPVVKWKGLIKNDFEKTVFKKFPELLDIKSELYSLGAVYASMSGSGSALFGIFKNIPELSGKFEKYFTWSGRIQV